MKRPLTIDGLASGVQSTRAARLPIGAPVIVKFPGGLTQRLTGWDVVDGEFVLTLEVEDET